MVCFSLLYDFALRRGEAVGLDMEDVSVDGLVQLNLRPEVQKGQNKREITLYSCFTESQALIHRYLEMRFQIRSAEPAFLLARSGSRLLASGVARAVQSQCQKLDITTDKGRKPGAHRLRHSFGTLNVEPLGLSMSIYEMMGRLRHEDYRTTHRVYVDDNPLLQKQRHLEMLKKSKSRTTSSGDSDPPPIRIGIASDFDLPEADAIEMLSKFSVKVSALRKYATETQNGVEQGGEWAYSRNHVEDLAKNFLSKRGAASMLKMSNMQLHHWTKKHGIKRVVIGKASLIRAADLLTAIGSDSPSDHSAATK